MNLFVNMLVFLFKKEMGRIGCRFMFSRKKIYPGPPGGVRGVKVVLKGRLDDGAVVFN